MSVIHQGSSDTTNDGEAAAVPARYVAVSITLRRRVKLTRPLLRQFFIEPPLIAMLAQLLDSSVRLTFVLGQGQAQPPNDLPRPDQGVADAMGQVLATGCHCGSMFALCSRVKLRLICGTGVAGSTFYRRTCSKHGGVFRANI